MAEEREKELILWFRDLSLDDIPLVGGKNAALGEMYANFSQFGIGVPDGFAVTAHAYREFLKESGIEEKMKEILRGLDTGDVRDLQKRGKAVRAVIRNAAFPKKLEEAIRDAYRKLGEEYEEKNPSTAVRSSATAEDLPGASFAGQQETYLNVSGEEDILKAVKNCIASLFTDRAISYRKDKGFAHFDVALSVGVQRMVRSDMASSGVAFSIDTETGFEKTVIINASYGLGEMVVQGKVTPDEYVVFKPTLREGYSSIIGKTLGEKDVKMIYSKRGTRTVPTDKKVRSQYCLSDEEILRLAHWVAKIEEYFSEKHGRYQPMDTEWAKDGVTGELFIVQARPETVHSIGKKNVYYEYLLKEYGRELARGTAVGAKIATGAVNVIKDTKNIHKFKKGEVLVTKITDPDWEPIMKIASAIVTDKGGRTSHAAIVSRELGIPCIVGSKDATRALKSGKKVTIDCSSGGDGVVYEGELDFEVKEHYLDKIPETKTKVMVNIGSPEEAVKNHFLPAKGVGLGRLEFIINSYIQVHPNALIDYEKIKNAHEVETGKLVKQIDEITAGYDDKTAFYIEELAEGIAKIAAVVWPEEAIIRFSDFKTNEYRSLLGGELYEPEESNPMIGWRGASRYYHPKFAEAFALECRAMKRVRDLMGLKNVVPMVPFCRTISEAEKVLAIMKEAGLDREADKSLKVYMMCEVPSNVILAEQFLEHFDGFSIGTNDLAQLTLGLDRDSDVVSGIANENNEAVRKSVRRAIEAALEAGKYIGLCGQAPSDYPEFAEFIVRAGITSLSLNPDTVIKTLQQVAAIENEKNFPRP